MDNIISDIQLFMFVHTFQWTSSEFFLISDFLVEILEANKTSEKITHFTIQFRSKNLTNFTNLNSLDIESNMLSQ